MAGFDERFERLIDKQIREATERGAFDDLPGQGKPLANADTYTDDWWLRDLGKREDLGPYALPVPLALRREAQNLLAGTVEARSEAKLREAVADYNERADKARRVPHPGPSVVIPTVDADEAVAAWRKHKRD